MAEEVSPVSSRGLKILSEPIRLRDSSPISSSRKLVYTAVNPRCGTAVAPAAAGAFKFEPRRGSFHLLPASPDSLPRLFRGNSIRCSDSFRTDRGKLLDASWKVSRSFFLCSRLSFLSYHSFYLISLCRRNLRFSELYDRDTFLFLASIFTYAYLDQIRMYTLCHCVTMSYPNLILLLKFSQSRQNMM